MNYEINKEYPIEEFHNIEEWWKDNRQYDINCSLTAVTIVPKDPKVYAEICIEELNNKLSETDYITAKLSEAAAIAQITGDRTDLDALFSKYEKLIGDRQKWRLQIREYEAILNN